MNYMPPKKTYSANVLKNKSGTNFKNINLIKIIDPDLAASYDLLARIAQLISISIII